MNRPYITGKIEISELTVPQVSTRLEFIDFLGAVMVRWGIRREKYTVAPGLYAVGDPIAESDVFVTSNYKLTFDHLRKNLPEIDGWILVLDTKGVNVWCAAGKGTFGTNELVKRIREVSLEKIVSHKRLILPQLGATGVAAHKVKEQTGFNVHYGPVLASDIKKFISDGYRADKAMRKVKFGFIDRIKLIPNDFMYGKYYLLASIAILAFLSGLSSKGLSFQNFYANSGESILTVFLAYVAGIVITPLLLPYLPGKQFSLKGLFSGTVLFAGIFLLRPAGHKMMETFSWLFIIGAISSFVAMNFTGSSTYTSLSGVKKEMKLFVPVQISFAIIGIAMQLIGKLIL
ncbi:MAG TPA: mercury methylation corrinoid protein HgcA [Bacteroidales bacterium]|nr:mercury methylation corrinoid protein HgcA [Bacteroidales bacterium]